METIKGARALDTASSGGPADRHSIDWKLVMKFVGKAQTRIAQAELGEDYRRVKRASTEPCPILASQGTGSQESYRKPREADEWHRPRTLSGSGNRALLHPVCHRRVHALGLEVTKPVPARGL